MKVQDVHVDSLETSTVLSRYYMPHAITPHEVISVLNSASISFVLVGAHGIGGWMKDPRATQDVDVIVAARHHKKAVRGLLAAFPQLEQDEHPIVTRLRQIDTKKVVIDVIKPHEQLYRAALKHTHTVHSVQQTFKIPSLEMAIALKFAPMISLHRADVDKYQDAHDFGMMIKSNPEIDMQSLAEFGELIYPGGGKELMDKVGRVRRGEKLNL